MSKLAKFTSISLALFCFFFYRPCLLQAKDLYVSPTGNDGNPGTEQSPFLSIQKGVDTATAGDNIILRAGVYSQKVNFNKSGTSGSPITLKAYTGEIPIIDGTNVDFTDSAYGGAIKLSNVSYISVESLTIRNIQRSVPTDSSYTPPKPTIDGPAGIKISNSNHITIKNNTTHNTSSSGIYATNSNNIIVDGNKVSLAVKGGSQECITLDSVTNFEIKNNEVFEGSNNYWGAEGIVVKVNSSQGTVHHNHVHNLPNEVAIYVDAYDGHTHDVEVFNNLVYATGEGIVTATEQTGTAENISFHHNIVYDVDGDGLYVSACCTQLEGRKNNISINNNTSYHNGLKYGGGITNRSAVVTNLFIKNNIVSQNNSWQIRDTAGIANVTNNLIFGFKNYTNEIKGSNYVESDPLFIDLNTHNFQLQSTSPAINAGVNLNFSQDFAGNPIPSGTAPDIGAYEYQGNSTTSPTPSPNCIQTTGDATGDGKVNLFDYTVFLTEFMKTNLTYHADFNCDKKVNILDYTIFLNNYHIT